MSKMILCPTRGGKDSYPNQDRAVALAKERGAGLMFLYITNVEFLGLTAAPILVDVEHEMDEMGEFMLAMAQERAEKAGVTASTLVERAQFQHVLAEVIEAYDIDSVVLGSSSGETGVVTESYIEGLVEELGGSTGVEFIIVHQGEVVATYQP